MTNISDPEDEMEEVTLLKVGMGDEDEDEDDDEEGNDYGTMTLSDGRQLTINPGDVSIAVCWSPTATLQLINADDGQVFDLIVRNKLYKQQIRARWI